MDDPRSWYYTEKSKLGVLVGRHSVLNNRSKITNFFDFGSHQFIERVPVYQLLVHCLTSIIGPYWSFEYVENKIKIKNKNENYQTFRRRGAYGTRRTSVSRQGRLPRESPSLYRGIFRIVKDPRHVVNVVMRKEDRERYHRSLLRYDRLPISVSYY